jgi:branched-subunit amino acid transport protein
LPTVLGYVVDYDSQGKIVFLTQPIFDEYDYWAGTVGLVFFALAETILFSWIFGIHKGWEEINLGSDMKIPIIFKYIIRYVTPVMLLAVFIGALITPPSSSVLHIHAKNKDHALYLSTVLLDQGFQDVKQHGNRLSGKLPKTEFKQRFPSIGALRTWAGTYAPELKKEEYRVEESQNWSLEFSNLFSGKGWNLDNNSLLKKGVNASEKAEITALELKLSNLSSLGLTLEAEQVEHEIALRREHLLLLNIGRTLLIILFAGISFLVYLAYLKRKKNPA